MKSITRTALAGIAAAVLTALSAAGSPAAAQDAAARPVVVAIPEVFPATGEPGGRQGEVKALVVRLASADHDMILLPRTHATPETLAAALDLLKRFRSALPNPAQDRVATLVSFPPARAEPRSLAALGAILAELRAAPQSPLGSFRPAPLRALGPGRKTVIAGDGTIP